MELPLMIDINLGLRRGELLGLKWKHIDFENKLISIEDNVVEVESDVSPDRIFTKAPKSQSGKRVIPISSTLNEYLKKKNLKHIRLHDLRHTNATLMLAQGISPKVAQVRLGHSDCSITMNTYSHVLRSVETEAAEKIENVIFGGMIG